jgi:hypothetical protein
MNDEAETDYFQFTIKCYDSSGLRGRSTFLQKCVSVYILYPLLIVLYLMVIINFRYKHNSIFEIAEVFSSVACFGHVILQPQNHKYIFQIICFIWLLLVRKTAIIAYGPLFEDLYRKRFYLWKYDLFGKIKGNQYRKRMATCVSLIKFI